MIKNSIIFFLVVFLLSCNRLSYKDYPNLSDKEVKILDKLKDDFKADDIKLSKADSFNIKIDKSISITLVNSKNTRLTDSSLSDYCYNIAKKFIEASLPERKYNVISIYFEERIDIMFFHKWKSNGQIYFTENINKIIREINDPGNRLEQFERRNEFDSIISYSNRLIRDSIDIDIAFSYQGLAYYNLNDTVNAFNSFKKARQFDKISSEILMNLAICSGSQNDYSGALKYIDTALTLQKDYPKAIYYRGIYNYYIGNKQKGCDDLLKAEKLGVIEATTFLYFNCK